MAGTMRERLTTVFLAVTLLVPSSGAHVAAQATASCSFITAEDLDGLSDLRLGEPLFATESGCFWETPEDEGGPYTLSVALLDPLFGRTMDVFRTWLADNGFDVSEVDVGDETGVVAPGFGMTDGPTLVFPVADRIFTVEVKVDESPQAAGLDQVAFAVGVAEAISAKVLAGGGPPLTSDPRLPDVEGFSYRGGRGFAGEDVATEASEGDLLLLTPLVEATGTSLDQTAFRTGIITDDDGRVGEYWILQLRGSDATTLTPVLIEFLRGQIPDELTVTDGELAGRAVTVVSVGENRMVFHGDADKLYLLSMPDEDAARILEALQ